LLAHKVISTIGKRMLVARQKETGDNPERENGMEKAVLFLAW
jgi:hypothetical protein